MPAITTLVQFDRDTSSMQAPIQRIVVLAKPKPDALRAFEQRITQIVKNRELNRSPNHEALHNPPRFAIQPFGEKGDG
jgi:hypothetical protein